MDCSDSALSSAKHVELLIGSLFNFAGAPSPLVRYTLKAISSGSVPRNLHERNTFPSPWRMATRPRPRFSIWRWAFPTQTKRNVLRKSDSSDAAAFILEPSLGLILGRQNRPRRSRIGF